MYRKRNHNQVSVDDFIPPFGGKLSADNRWVKLSRVIPWDQVEERYAARFGKCGNVAIPLRVALHDTQAEDTPLSCGASPGWQGDSIIEKYLRDVPQTVDLTDTPDLLMPLALYAALQPGRTTRFTGCGR